MELAKIIQLLKNSGFHILGTDGTFLHLEDPACFLRSFSDFMDIGWMVLGGFAALLFFGWAVSLIRGAPMKYLITIRNTALIFGIMAAVKPAINFIYGDDLFAVGCKTIMVPIAEVNRILALRDAKLDNGQDIEMLDIWDSQSGDKYIEEAYNAEFTTRTGAPIGSGNPEQIDGIQVGAKPAVASVSFSGTSSLASVAMGNDVVYTGPDGQRYKRTGGTRAWKNKNPGNIRTSEFARKMGAIGQAGGFAVFPSEQVGKNAIKKLLLSRGYINLTISGAISRYAPPSENNTAAYHRRLGQLTGLAISMLIRSLTNEQLDRVVNAITVVEGWKPGREVPL